MPLLRAQGNANVFKTTLQPVGWLDGDLWIDLSQSPRILNINNNGSAIAIFLNAQSNVTIAGITDTLEHFMLSLRG